MAKYSGVGDWRAAVNWVQGEALFDAMTQTGAGSCFYTPHAATMPGVVTP